MVHDLMSAVSEGGTLPVVDHDPESHFGRIDREHPMPFDPEAYLLTDDFAAVLADSDEWEVEVHEQRPRTDGHDSTHADDVVLRARRLGAAGH